MNLNLCEDKGTHCLKNILWFPGHCFLFVFSFPHDLISVSFPRFLYPLHLRSPRFTVSDLFSPLTLSTCYVKSATLVTVATLYLLMFLTLTLAQGFPLKF